MDNKRAGIQEFLQARLKNVTDTMGTADDAYQGFVRDNILQLPKQGMLGEGDNAHGIRNFLGETFAAARPGATDVNPHYQLDIRNGGDRAGAVVMRSAHGGAITAAGAGLVELGRAIGNAFGGPADGQTSQQIPM